MRLKHCLHQNDVYTLVFCDAGFRITEVEERGGLLHQYRINPRINIVTRLCPHSMSSAPCSPQLKIPV